MLCALGYEHDERSSLGERGKRRRWRMKRPERVAGVGEGRRHIVAKDIRRAPQQGRYAEPLFIDVRRKDKTVLPDKMNSTPKAKHFGVLFIL